MTIVCLREAGKGTYELLDCRTGQPIELGKAGKVKRAKRAPSAYNIFLGQCVKGKTGDIKVRFKSCVEEWKKKKGK